MAYHNRSWPQTTATSSNPLNSTSRSLSLGSSTAPTSTRSSPLTPLHYRRSTTPTAPMSVSRTPASEIIPRVYISDLSFAENPSLLGTYQITHILSILPETVCLPHNLHAILGYAPVRLQINVEDLPFSELAAHLPTTTAFIRDALRGNPEARVLVHCVEGISRSASVVAAFLMAQYGWTPREAVGYVKEKRKIANPNFGFVKQLYEYGRDVLGHRGLVEGM